jgi:biopolymer transport protein ExbB/TolQ
METLSNILYWLSSGLFVPVMLGTVIMFFYSLCAAGVFYGSYKEYARYSKEFRYLLRKPAFGELMAAVKKMNNDQPAEISRYVEQLLKNHASRAAMEGILGDFEIEADKSLGKYKTIARLGPILGLMGTLIPMGPALAGLGQGDVASMSWNMQVAFATTVIGLFAGTVGFLLLQPHQRMLVRYLSDMEVLVGHIAEHKDGGGEHQYMLERLLNEKID